MQNVVAGYGSMVLLDGLDMKASPGEILGIQGKNGAGKSTLLHTIMGLTRIHSGQITFEQSTITKLPTREIIQKRISYASQKDGIFPELTVYENLSIAATRSQLSASQQKSNCNDIIKIFNNLKEVANFKTKTMSGGIQKLISIAMAFLVNPKLLLIDEPSIGLHKDSRDQVEQQLRTFTRNGGCVILVEQDMVFMNKLANRVLTLKNGKICE